MRIRKGRLYLVERPVRDSSGNFRSEMERRIVTGQRRDDRINIVSEAQLDPLGRYRCFDGHLPEHCPIVNGIMAEGFLAANPCAEIERVS